MDTNTSRTVRVLMIDAWRESEGGWNWNAWYGVGHVALEVCDYTPRRLLAYMREAGFLSAASRGKCAIDDDGHNVVIMARGTREPLFALEYGAND